MRPSWKVASGRTVINVGGGYAGSLLALKLPRSRPEDHVVVIERRLRVGAGLAYGACDGGHLLNVPVSRMESGLEPSFPRLLEACKADLSEALKESGGELADALVPRALFGRYMEERFVEALSSDPARGVHHMRGDAVRVLKAPRRGVVLEDGREVEGDALVAATGDMAPNPRALAVSDAVGAAATLVVDPWDAEALADIHPDSSVLLVGAGLTMVDIALRSTWSGRCGPITAISRRGRLPQRHVAGRSWPGSLADAAPATPLAALRLIRAHVSSATAAGVPWQRVFDAARPDVARIWRGWSLAAASCVTCALSGMCNGIAWPPRGGAAHRARRGGTADIPGRADHPRRSPHRRRPGETQAAWRREADGRTRDPRPQLHRSPQRLRPARDATLRAPSTHGFRSG